MFGGLTRSISSCDEKCLALYSRKIQLENSQTSGSYSSYLTNATQPSVSAGEKTAVAGSYALQCLLQILLQDAAVLV